MLQNRQRQQRSEQRKAGCLESACFGRHSLLHQKSGDYGGDGDRYRKQKVHRFVGKKAFEELRALGQPFLGQVAHAQKYIQLGAPAHPPENHVSPDTDLVGTVPGESKYYRGYGYDR